VVLGAGGAARAVIDALGRAGAAEVVVVNRSRQAAEVAAALPGVAGGAARVGGVDAITSADLVVNATPVGMAGGPHAAVPCPPDLVPVTAVAVDLIYDPLETPWLAALRARHVTACNGLSMLVHQAARQFESWTAVEAPIEAMHQAVAAHLAGRGGF
jgi:shikimate dehydrogenase